MYKHKKIKQNIWILFISILISGCGGGSSVSTSEELILPQTDETTQVVISEPIDSTPVSISTSEINTATDNTSLVITSVTSKDTQTNSTLIAWKLNANATGQVEYGETTDYGNYNIKETTFNYDSHTQPINNLKEDTVYHYRVISEDENGNKVVSQDDTFKTLPADLKTTTEAVITTVTEPISAPVSEPIVEATTAPVPAPVPEPIVAPIPEPAVVELSAPLVSIDLNSNLDTWSVVNAQYDATQSYDNKPGSVKFTDTFPCYIISNLSTPVKPGEVYTLTARIKSELTHSGAISLKGAIKGGDGSSQNLFGTYMTNSKANEWENVITSIKIPDDTTHNQLYVKVVKESFMKGTVWIDNIELRKGVQLENRPVKKNFTGSKVQVDTLGNVKVDGAPYFPISVFADGARDFNIYKNQGFNTIAWARSVGTFQKAKDAGLMANFEMAYYISFDGNAPAQTQSQLSVALNSLKDAGLMDTMLFYYWDNEFYHYDKEVDEVASIINTIDTVDGQRMHPNLMLAGNYGHTRIYNNFIDISGTYTGRDLTSASPVTYLGEPLVYNLQMQDFTENQDTPSAIGQFNAGVNERFRALIFGGIANGMKGFGYWRDSATGQTNAGRILDVTQQVWWDDFPSITAEIQQMLDAGLIQSSHLTSFKAISNQPIDKIISGTRLLNNSGYIIMGNTTDQDITVTFTLDNLAYTPRQVTSFFDGAEIGTVSGNTITVNVPAFDSRVIKLEP